MFIPLLVLNEIPNKRLLGINIYFKRAQDTLKRALHALKDALLWKMRCNLRHPMGLRHPVPTVAAWRGARMSRID